MSHGKLSEVHSSLVDTEKESEREAHEARNREEMAATFSGCITRASEAATATARARVAQERAVSSHLA